MSDAATVPCLSCDTDIPPPTGAAEVPLCEACRQKLQRQSLPPWLWILSAAVVLAAATLLPANYHYLSAYVRYQAAEIAQNDGRLHDAHAWAESAVSLVPGDMTLEIRERMLRSQIATRDRRYADAAEAIAPLVDSAGDLPELREHLLQLRLLASLIDDPDRETLERAHRFLDAHEHQALLRQELLTAHVRRWRATGNTWDARKLLPLARKVARETSDPEFARLIGEVLSEVETALESPGRPTEASP
ncbi:MAG: hypothetical protein R3336_04615 [Phycisphaeraceae bacterium]|nr:hypothetical protein [Phycisphaeraceae bacterium]